MNEIKNLIDYNDFLKVDIRVVIREEAKVNKKAKNPAYILTIDFGKTIGVKISSAQITQNYTLEELIGKQISAVINFPPKRVAGVKSEVLLLAVVSKDSGTILIEATKDVVNGDKIA